MPRKKREKLFYQGVAAATAVFGTTDKYFCPICARECFAPALDEGELTLEHVPPKSQGGKAIILTCRGCNNVAGHTVDANAAGRSELARFSEVIRGKGTGDAGATVLTIGEHKVRVQMSNDEGTTAFEVIGAANNPETVQKAMNELRRAYADGSWEEGFEIQVTKSVKYNPKMARISDLRAAFLACTAKMGYRFAFSGALEAIREQILNPDKELIPKWSINLTKPVSTPAMAISGDRGLVIVLLGSGAVVLPWPPSGADALRKAAVEGADGRKVTFQATPLEWPRSFDAILDRGEANALTRAIESDVSFLVP